MILPNRLGCILSILIILSMIFAGCTNDSTKATDPYKTDKTHKMSAKEAISLARNYFNNSGDRYYYNMSLVRITYRDYCSYLNPDAGNCTGWNMKWNGIIIKNGSYYFQVNDMGVFYNDRNILTYSHNVQIGGEVYVQNLTEEISYINNETMANWTLDSYQAYKIAEKEMKPLDDKYVKTNIITRVKMYLTKWQNTPHLLRWDIVWSYYCKNQSGYDVQCGFELSFTMDADSGDRII